MKDIENRADLLLLLQRFYQKLLADASINYLFTDVAKIDLEAHLPILVDFWDMVLFGAPTYQKNLLQLHMDLHRQSTLTAQHFQTWLSYFETTVDELFQGEKAFLARQRARSIATVMQIKTLDLPVTCLL